MADRKAIPNTDEDLDAQAEITPADLDDARAWASGYMPAPFDDLAEADPADPDSLPQSPDLL